jgi:hypothetical protein
MKFNIPFVTIFVVVIILCSASQCHDESLSTGEDSAECKHGQLPEWLKDLVSDLEQGSTKGKITQYFYHHKTVYLINLCLNCDDSGAEVYDCQRNVICRFGGIAGLYTCPDFNSQAKNERVIWRN